jgi:hypothetical protein
MEVIGLSDGDRWDREVFSMVGFDVYHTAGYNFLEGSGIPFLLCFSSFGGRTVMPVVLRFIDGVSFCDVTSVYGYGGPLSDVEKVSAAHAAGFRDSLRDFFDSRLVVSAFSRLHPLFGFQSDILRGLGEVSSCGTTVVIDLGLSEREQLEQYSRSLRYFINRTRKAGRMTVRGYSDSSEIDAFVQIYHETMLRVGAADRYFFDADYFHRFLELTPSELFLAFYDGRIVGGTLFTKCNGIIEIHLSGTRDGCLDLSPVKYIWNEIRRYGTEHGFRFMHMGGGLGGRRDTLYDFKSQFSRISLPFSTWRYIHLPDVYRSLTPARNLGDSAGLDFFPAYRCE